MNLTTFMLTPKQLRDIASYWGAPCTYKKVVNNEWIFIGKMQVMAHVLQSLQDGEAIDFRLHLRAIKSLTDKELMHCGAIHGEFEEAFIDRYSESMRMGNFQLFFDGRLYNHEWEPVDYNATMKIPVHNPGAIIGYLQSLAVYVPGTVDKEFVSIL
ncbi:hypothetical protein GCM10027592_54240 [Spirosoma flavus]